MRLLALTLLTLCIAACNKDLVNTKNTGYYFCYSHKWKPQADSAITYILYTDIQPIHGDEQIIREKASKWGQLVHRRCKNTNGCTSDLMYYYTIQQAEANRNQVFELYKDPEKYIMEKVDFK